MENNGVVALVSCGTDSNYNNSFVQSFADKCTELGLRVLWFQSLSNKYDGDAYDLGEINIFNLINFDKIDALVLMSITLVDRGSVKEELVAKAKEHGVPVVSIDEDIDSAYSISQGYEEALEDVIRHVITEHGAKNIKFLAAMKGNDVSDAREEVFRNVMAEYGLEVNEDSVDYGYFWWAGASDAVQRHYDKFHSMPEAFICANDSMAVGVCSKLNELGYLVPDDVIVTGIDGIPEGNTHFPSITTLMRDMPGAAGVAAQRILQIIKGEIPPVGSETIAGTILYRESCGCEAARLTTEDNKIKRELYGEIDLWNGFSDRVVLMSEAATGGYTFDETLEKIKPFLKDLWTKECWLCICDDFVTGVESLEDVYLSYDTYRKTGYSERIQYVLHGVNDECYDFLEPFSTAEMLPDFDKLMEKYDNFLFMPLHFQDRTIGYVAFEFKFVDRNYHLLHTLITNISRVLENARIQSELKTVVGRLEDMYIRDSMTNLYNRRGFYQFTPKLYEKCVAESIGFMIVSVDLDNLKGINDTYGHHEGDNAITTIAKALKAAAGENDIVARFGGDEYIASGICLSDDYAENFLNRFKSYLDEYNASSGKPYLIEASCGTCSLSPASEKSIDEFIKSADELMYAQKAIHRKHRGYSRDRM
ncbi:MAG: GGDEF domain-containing protein [Oscillospiraceae bacterium]|nr:GGDEF domain-containing protein [Oscillospiraceae bacterium]